jgi:hypothetical protein
MLKKSASERSRFETILNVARGYASGAFIGCGLVERSF